LASGLHRAAIGGIEHAVLVVVGIRAAVAVLEAVLVLGLGRAAVEVVGEPVAVGVLGRATVELGDPRRERALVGDVEHAVVVVIGVRAAVAVLEPVVVLGIIRAAVGHVEDAVVIAILDRLSLRAAAGQSHAQHEAAVGCAVAMRQPGARTGEQLELRIQLIRRTEQGLDVIDVEAAAEVSDRARRRQRQIDVDRYALVAEIVADAGARKHLIVDDKVEEPGLLARQVAQVPRGAPRAELLRQRDGRRDAEPVVAEVRVVLRLGGEGRRGDYREADALVILGEQRELRRDSNVADPEARDRLEAVGRDLRV
jgi:hypothetical protein